MSAAAVARRSVADKLALAGGVASLALVSSTNAEAAIVAAQGTPKSPTFSAQTTWDIDGDGSGDFRLSQFGGSTTSTSGAVVPYRYASLNELGVNRFVAKPGVVEDGFANLASGFQVGPVMSGGHFFFAERQSFISATYTYSGAVGLGGDLDAQGWAFNTPGFFGFRFMTGGDLLYGWGELIVKDDGTGFSILRAYYDDTGAEIKAGDTGATVIPEPSTCALALLAVGGVAAYRARRKVPAA